MSILISMDMPTRCCDCPVCGHDYQFCRLAEKDFDEFDCVKSRADWCPLIELPPHGRLIDADALIMVTEMVNGEWKSYYEVFEINEAPTIIEAEKGKT